MKQLLKTSNYFSLFNTRCKSIESKTLFKKNAFATNASKENNVTVKGQPDTFALLPGFEHSLKSLFGKPKKLLLKVTTPNKRLLFHLVQFNTKTLNCVMESRQKK
jgi:hypothetical protein